MKTIESVDNALGLSRLGRKPRKHAVNMLVAKVSDEKWPITGNVGFTRNVSRGPLYKARFSSTCRFRSVCCVRVDRWSFRIAFFLAVSSCCSLFLLCRFHNATRPFQLRL